MTGLWRFVFAYSILIMTVVGFGACLERCERPRPRQETQTVSTVTDSTPRPIDVQNFGF